MRLTVDARTCSILYVCMCALRTLAFTLLPFTQFLRAATLLYIGIDFIQRILLLLRRNYIDQQLRQKLNLANVFRDS